MSSVTLNEAIEATGFDVLDYLDRSVTIPAYDGIQAQGDLAIIPAGMVAGQVRVRRDAEWAEVGRAGVVLLRGTADGNAHTVLSGRYTTDVTDSEGLAIGVIDAAGPATYVAHREHGYVALAPGRYVVRRQREMADVQRLVAD